MAWVDYALVSSPDPTSKEEKGPVNLGRILKLALRNFHVPMRSQLWLSHDKLTAGMQHRCMYSYNIVAVIYIKLFNFADQSGSRFALATTGFDHMQTQP